MEDKIVEGNKLIAEFMGAEERVHPLWGLMYFYQPHITPSLHASLWWNLDGMRYSESWDWLMPVVEKIASIEYMNFNLSSFEGAVFYDDDYKNTATGLRKFNKSDSLLNSTWLAVVEFIKWYNQNK